ncbi:hypothetical protein QJQ45_005074 [Haematococcus lacustris]|nr:hypothetical protein QJQ45_005074 [Haematococcus lacustris]
MVTPAIAGTPDKLSLIFNSLPTTHAQGGAAHQREANGLLGLELAFTLHTHTYSHIIAQCSRQLSHATQDLVQEWLLLDDDPTSRHQVQQLVAAGNEAQLQHMMSSRLEFGTAGLRGRMGPGFNAMNRVTVQQASQGLAAYLEQQLAPDLLSKHGVVIGQCREPPAFTGGCLEMASDMALLFMLSAKVVRMLAPDPTAATTQQQQQQQQQQEEEGYDGRHQSRTFAHLAAAVFLQRGMRVHLFSDLVPTPWVAAGVAELGAAAGVMITASHNPKQDNGYKVYW